MGRGNFLSSFLCLHSFASSVAGIGVQVQAGQAALNGRRQLRRAEQPNVEVAQRGARVFGERREVRWQADWASRGVRPPPHVGGYAAQIPAYPKLRCPSASSA